MIYIGLDDTDNLESRGTGHLAREIASALEDEFKVMGITRHQLSRDERVPCTKNNSSACVHLSTPDGPVSLIKLAERIKEMMLADFQPGSDPGLCLGMDIPAEIGAFGREAQQGLVTQTAARELAANHNLYLEGLGGTQDGVIGALCAVGLAAGGYDGRYIQLGKIRQLSGVQPLQTVLDAGIKKVRLMDQTELKEGQFQTDKLRPSRRGFLPVLYVEERDGIYWPLKLD